MCIYRQYQVRLRLPLATREGLMGEILRAGREQGLRPPALYESHLDQRVGSWGQQATEAGCGLMSVALRCAELRDTERAVVADIVDRVDALAGRSWPQESGTDDDSADAESSGSTLPGKGRSRWMPRSLRIPLSGGSGDSKGSPRSKATTATSNGELYTQRYTIPGVYE